MPVDMKNKEVAITGLSGRLPECSSIQEFKDNLFNGVDMVTEDDRRWRPGIYGTPARCGKLKNEDIDKLDASFFGMSPKQADTMDPQLRMLLEITYEAIVDAGVNPYNIRGSNCGIFVGVVCSEAFQAWTKDPDNTAGYTITGCALAMFANRLSYHFDFTGPSFALDNDNSSGMSALDHAVIAIQTGQCDSAIVAATTLNVKPAVTVHLQKLGVISPDGASRSFDAAANGYARSDGVVALFLQKAPVARRIYANVINVKVKTDGYKDTGFASVSADMQRELMLQTYAECGVDPSQVAYVEAYASGEKDKDEIELNAIADVFCKEGKRKEPLLIGSSKSNVGNTEATSGLVGIAKVLLALEEGLIPANLHYKTPNPNIPALTDGRLKVVDKHMPLNGEYVAVNACGSSTANVHLVLRAQGRKAEKKEHPAAEDMRLFTYSARTKEGMENIFAHIQDNASDVEMQALLQANANGPPSLLPFRGYTILNHEEDTQDIKQVGSSAENRPVWYIFSGMGSQWPGMARDMMNIDVFRKSLEKSDATLKPFGVELINMIEESTDETFSSPLNSFVCIVSIQVALVDVLTCIGIQPDGIIGHSVGELGCAYADGGLTAEETVTAAYYRGRCVLDAQLPPGAMAAVGLTWEQAKERCPEGVVPACHNAQDTVTISGPAETVREFVKQLKSEDIFAKEVNSSGIAFHSYFLKKKAGPDLLVALKKVIKQQRRRTARWISSSIPEDDWVNEIAAFSSPEYHVNNFVSPVLFQEALQNIPPNSVTIEIAPHCLLQSILKRSLPSDCVFTSMMKKNVDGPEWLFTNIGNIHMSGIDTYPLNLHAPVTFPVSTGTPLLGQLCQWEHSQSWDVPTVNDFMLGGGTGGVNSSTNVISLAEDSPDSYLAEYQIEGTNYYPVAGYLVLVWRTLARMECIPFESIPVRFDDIHVHEATILSCDTPTTLHVHIHPGSGSFELRNDDTKVLMTGKISQVPKTEEQVEKKQRKLLLRKPSYEILPLGANDIYEELKLRGYEYGPAFRSIGSCDTQGRSGNLLWTGQWIPFLDSIMQLGVLLKPGLRLATRIKTLQIDPQLHIQLATQDSVDAEGQVSFLVDTVLNKYVSGGIEITGLHTTTAPTRKHRVAPQLEQYSFVPYNRTVIIEDGEEYMNECIAGLKSSSANSVQDVTKTLGKAQSTTYKAVKGPKPTNLVTLEKNNNTKAFLNFLKNAGQKDADFNPLDDELLGAARQPATMKSCLQIAMENAPEQGKLKVVEYGDGRFYEQFLPWLERQPVLEYEYVVVGGNENADNNIKSCQWDMIGTIPNELTGADLVLSDVVSFDSNLPSYVSAVTQSLTSGGFLVLHGGANNHKVSITANMLLNQSSTTKYELNQDKLYDETKVSDTILDSNLRIVGKVSSGVLNSLFLCRKVGQSTDEGGKKIDVSSVTPSWVDDIKEAMATGEKVWLTSTTGYNGVVGMTACLRKEADGGNIRCMSFEDKAAQEKEQKRQKELDLVMNVFRRGQWGHYVSLPLEQDETTTTESNYAYLNIAERGNLSSLQWLESPLKNFSAASSRSSETGLELHNVHYAALCNRDILLATDNLPSDAIPADLAKEDSLLGMEYSGTDASGQNVFGIVPAKALATNVAANKRFTWPVPKTWGLREAASVPLAYATAYYALIVRGDMQKGDTVLVHSGEGDVGQAAITLALHNGCRVFTTVDSQEKREYLKSIFPQLKDENITFSRDTSFETHVMHATGGTGCDVILNSLTGDKLQASLRCLAMDGRFLETSKHNLAQNTPLGMAILLKNVSIHGILLDSLFVEEDPDWEQVSKLMGQGLKDGVVKPLKTTVFNKGETEQAFRFMAQGKATGKVVIRMRDNGSLLSAPRAQKRVYFDASKSYIVTGGLSGVGLRLTQWLIDRGAKQIILTSRLGIKSGYQSKCLLNWNDLPGVKVTLTKVDLSSYEQAEKLIGQGNAQGGLGGIFHLDEIVRDGAMANQIVQNFKDVFQPKVKGALNLDMMTRRSCRHSLTWFVMFSSSLVAEGQAGRAASGFANNYMERLCDMRQREGLTGLAIQWGGLDDVVEVSDSNESRDLRLPGMQQQRISSCLATLDKLLSHPQSTLRSYVLAKK